MFATDRVLTYLELDRHVPTITRFPCLETGSSSLHDLETHKLRRHEATRAYKRGDRGEDRS